MAPLQRGDGALRRAKLHSWLQCWAWLSTLSAVSTASAEWGGNAEVSRPARVSARSETSVRIFQRALLPGPGGALVETNTLVPVTEYWSLYASDLPSAIDGGELDAEVSGWANAQLLDPRYEERALFDISAAWVRQSFGPAYLSLGRQAVFGGAARYVRFDGARAGIRAVIDGSWRLGADAYGGYTVLPRWDDRPGYYYLGSTADSLALEREALGDPSRAGHFLVGTRADLAYASRFFAALTFHQQHGQRALERRDLGAATTVAVSDALEWTADVVIDTDSWWVSNARTWLDVQADERWLVSLEYLHSEPRLLLTRQSVLSVFDTSGFDEVGAVATFQPWSHLDLTGRGYLEWFADAELGARVEGRVGAFVDRGQRTRTTVSYSRIHLIDGGYHALRTTLSQRVLVPLQAVAEAYFYWYDRPINDRHSSNVYAVNLLWSQRDVWHASVGTSLAQTPYARSDLQSLVRVSWQGELGAASP